MQTYTIQVQGGASITIEYIYDDGYSYHIDDYNFNDYFTVWCFTTDNKVEFSKSTETLDEAFQIMNAHIKERQEQ